MTADVSAMVYGIELVLDLEGCLPHVIGSRDTLAEFAERMVKVIDMTAYGEPILEHFGHGDPIISGWTLVQLIETSSIVGHFSDQMGHGRVNIFSCKVFDPAEAAFFAAQFLTAQSVKSTVLIR